MGTELPLGLLSLLTAAFVLLYLRDNSAQRGRDPPGPKRLPIVGNLFDFPLDKQWVTFMDWKAKYGDLVYVNIIGKPMLILNSTKACIDLLEKRSKKYSGRPKFIVISEFMGFDYSFPIMDYSPRWLKYRRLFHQHFNKKKSLTYRPIQQRGVHHFLQRLLTTPEDFLRHTRTVFGETILDLVYDIKAEEHDNIFIQAAEKAILAAIEVAIPGRFLVEFFPSLRYLPSWFPGGTFKKFAAERKQAVLDARDLPFNHAKMRMEEGTAGPSVLASMLDKCSENLSNSHKTNEESPEDIAKSCAALAYLGGADTTLSTMQAFFMAIANNQGVQQAAWAEIDALLGSSPTRLPSFEDEANLPYVVAITKELLRWHNVVPLGLPHLLTEDDEYDGYFIRKGTVVLPNIWGILHDPEAYPDPMSFNPKRWLIDTPKGPTLNMAIQDPNVSFGFGRRKCPGRHFALNTLFITVASILACFEVRPLDVDGKPNNGVKEEFTSGLLIYPAPYNVAITPRSEHWVRLIKELAV